MVSASASHDAKTTGWERENYASFLTSCQPLPCFLHADLLQLLAAGCLSSSLPRPGTVASLKWICKSVALDKAGQLKSVHPSPKLLLRRVPPTGGLAGPLVYLFITLDWLWTISGSPICPLTSPTFLPASWSL